MKELLLLSLLVIPKIKSTPDEPPPDTSTKTPFSTAGKKLLTNVIVPTGVQVDVKEINKLYEPKLDQTKNPNADAFNQMSDKIINSIDYWGQELHQVFADFRRQALYELQGIGFEESYFDYQNMDFEITAIYEIYLDYRAHMDSIHDSYVKGLVEMAAIRLQLTLSDFHERTFKVDGQTVRIIDTLKEFATKKSNLFARAMLFRFYCKHIGVLTKGWMIGTFSLDFYRTRNESDKEIDAMQNYITNFQPQNVQGCTNEISTFLHFIPNFKEGSIEENFNVPLADFEIGKKLDTDLDFDCPGSENLNNSACLNKPISYVFLVKSEADVGLNKVICGIQFAVMGATVVIKIEQATLLKQGEISRSDREWVPISFVNMTEPISAQVMFLKQSISLRKVEAKSPEYVMTGIRFMRKDEFSTGLQVTFHRFNFSTGELILDDFYTENNYDEFLRFAKPSKFVSSTSISSEVTAITGISFDFSKDPQKNKAVTRIHSIDYLYYINLEKVSIEGEVPLLNEDEFVPDIFKCNIKAI